MWQTFLKSSSSSRTPCNDNDQLFEILAQEDHLWGLCHFFQFIVCYTKGLHLTTIVHFQCTTSSATHDPSVDSHTLFELLIVLQIRTPSDSKYTLRNYCFFATEKVIWRQLLAFRATGRFATRYTTCGSMFVKRQRTSFVDNHKLFTLFIVVKQRTRFDNSCAQFDILITLRHIASSANNYTVPQSHTFETSRNQPWILIIDYFFGQWNMWTSHNWLSTFGVWNAYQQWNTGTWLLIPACCLLIYLLAIDHYTMHRVLHNTGHNGLQDAMHITILRTMHNTIHNTIHKLWYPTLCELNVNQINKPKHSRRRTGYGWCACA